MEPLLISNPSSIDIWWRDHQLMKYVISPLESGAWELVQVTPLNGCWEMICEDRETLDQVIQGFLEIYPPMITIQINEGQISRQGKD